MKSRFNIFQGLHSLLAIGRGVWVSLFLAVVLSACSPAGGKPLASVNHLPTQSPLASAVSTAALAATATMAAPVATVPTAAMATTAVAAVPQSTEATTAQPATSAAAGVSFANQVFPLLQNRCQSCHGGQKTAKNLSMNTYADLMKGAEDGVVIVPGDAKTSYLVELISNGKMPNRGKKLSASEIQLIVDWINAGAPNN